MDKHIATLDECVNSLFALALTIRNHGTCAPAALESVATKASAAIALMRGQSEPVADAAGKDAFLALADSLECFWNAALGATHPYDDATANAVMSGMVQGFAAVAFRLREHATKKPKDTADEQ